VTITNRLWAFSLLAGVALLGCSGESADGRRPEPPQMNEYFVIERRDVDNLTPATVISLRPGVDLHKISEHLGTLCRDYSWMNAKRFLHIFADSASAKLFDSFGIENIRAGKPVDKYVALFNPDEQALILFPLVKGKSVSVPMKGGWCRR
jgi:hypothetical protein